MLRKNEGVESRLKWRRPVREKIGFHLRQRCGCWNTYGTNLSYQLDYSRWQRLLRNFALWWKYGSRCILFPPCKNMNIKLPITGKWLCIGLLTVVASFCSAQPYGLANRPLVGPFLNNIMPETAPVVGTNWSIFPSMPDAKPQNGRRGGFETTLHVLSSGAQRLAIGR